MANTDTFRDSAAGRAATAGPTTAGPTAGASAAWLVAVVGSLMLAGAAAAFTKVWNFDIFWHLASGDWMLRNGRVLGFDPFTIDAQAQWVNVHWLFQVIVAMAHRVGGFELLTLLKVSLAAATMLIFAMSLRRRTPNAWLVVCGLAMLWVMHSRLRVRPEAFTFLFIVATVALLETVRLGANPRRLWWLVPVMLAWANMHGLYVVGLGIIWSAVIGAGVDRLLGRDTVRQLPVRASLAPLLAATIACLINPWTIEGAFHFLLLFTRVSGQSEHYTYGVSEFSPTWQALGSHKEFVLLLLGAAGVLAANRRAAPISHAVWLAAMGGLAMLASRNVSLSAPVLGYLLALHGAAVIEKVVLPRRRLSRLGRPLAVAAVVLAVANAAAYSTGLVGRWLDAFRQSGWGLQPANYPTAAGEFLRNLDAPGDLFCENFGDAGAFIYQFNAGLPRPRRLVFMDGRLEAHSFQRFRENSRIRTYLRTARGASWVQMHPAIRFLFVRHDSTDVLSALALSDRFQLIYVDPCGAVFARTDWPGPRGQLPRPDFADFDLPARADGMVADRPVRTWFDQNPPSVDYKVGTTFLHLGMQDLSAGAPLEARTPDRQRRRCLLLAIRYFNAALIQGVVNRWSITGVLAHAYQQQALLEAAHAQAVPVDINFARALRLYAQMGPRPLKSKAMQDFAFHRVLALVQSGQLQTAGAAIGEILDNLPPAQRVNPPGDYLELQVTIAEKIAEARVKASALAGKPLLDRARELCSPELRLTEDAIAELRAEAGQGGPASLMLGDLLLRTGDSGAARGAYARAKEVQAWQVNMRLALCDWVDGRQFEAAEALGRLAEESRQSLVRYYHAVVLEQLGLYAQAAKSLNAAATDTSEASLAEAIAAIKRHLPAK